MLSRKVLEQFETVAIDLETFRSRHPDLVHKQIAAIAGCAKTTIDKWHCGAAAPQPHHLLRLGLYDRWLDDAQA
jgi:hypothetical protein